MKEAISTAIGHKEMTYIHVIDYKLLLFINLACQKTPRKSKIKHAVRSWENLLVLITFIE